MHAARVLPEWVDYNGHMHESRYLQLFSDATDALLGHLGVDVSRESYFTVETHLSHLHEATADERVRVTTQLLDHDEKRLHLFHELRRDDALLATAEQMLLHVDAQTRRTGRRRPTCSSAWRRSPARMHNSRDPSARAARSGWRDELR